MARAVSAVVATGVIEGAVGRTTVEGAGEVAAIWEAAVWSEQAERKNRENSKKKTAGEDDFKLLN